MMDARAMLRRVSSVRDGYTNFDADRDNIPMQDIRVLWDAGLIAYRPTGERSAIFTLTQAGRQLMERANGK